MGLAFTAFRSGTYIAFRPGGIGNEAILVAEIIGMVLGAVNPGHWSCQRWRTTVRFLARQPGYTDAARHCGQLKPKLEWPPLFLTVSSACDDVRRG